MDAFRASRRVRLLAIRPLTDKSAANWLDRAGMRDMVMRCAETDNIYFLNRKRPLPAAPKLAGPNVPFALPDESSARRSDRTRIKQHMWKSTFKTSTDPFGYFRSPEQRTEGRKSELGEKVVRQQEEWKQKTRGRV